MRLREFRLTGAKAFSACFTGRRVHSQFFRAQVVAASDSRPRLGMAVSRKVSASAVERNKIRRLIRASFVAAQPGLAKTAAHVAVLANTSARDQSRSALRDDLGKLMMRVFDRPPPAAGAPLPATKR